MALEQSSQTDETLREAIGVIWREWCRHLTEWARELLAGDAAGEIRIALRNGRSELINRVASPVEVEIGSTTSSSGSAPHNFLSRIGRATAATLELPAELVLRRTRSMPKASRRNLSQALRYELERICPVPAEQLYFDLAIRPNATDQAKVDVDVRLIKRAGVDGALASIARTESRVGSIRFSGDPREADWRHFPVDPLARALLLWQRWRIPALATTLAVLMLATIAAGYGRGEQTLESINLQIASAEQQALAVKTVRRQASDIASQMRFLARQKQSAAVSAMIAELSRLLPDGTWVNEVDTAGLKIHIQGYSRRASDLIAIIDRSSLFTNARFGAPIVQSEAEGEQFDLAFDVRRDK